MPGSIIAFEVAFSTSYLIIDPYKSFLNLQMVEALIWLRSNKVLTTNSSASFAISEIIVEEMSLYDMFELGNICNT